MKIHQKIAEFIKEIKTESPEWVKERRREYLINRQREVQRQLSKDRLCAGKAILEGREELFIQKHIEKDEKDLKRIEILLNLLEVPEGEKLGYHEIAQAKENPISKFLDIVPGKKIKCPFHNDKNPSMHIYKTQVWCFVCNRGLDAIGWLREVDGLSFVAAVRRLNHA